MSSIISALDSGMENKTLGEKGHVEYDWSEKNDEDLLTQFFFQMEKTFYLKIFYLLDYITFYFFH